MSTTRGRVVLFTPGLSEPGGAARRTRLLIDGLSARGWDVRVVARAGTLNSFKLHRGPGPTVIEVPGFRRPRLGAVLYLPTAIVLGCLWGIRARAYISIQLLSQSVAGWFCSTATQKSHIVLSTTAGSVSELGYIKESRLFRFRRWMLRRADLLIAQTASGAQELSSALAIRQIDVLPNPVRLRDAPPFTGEVRALFSGRFSEEKDLHTLLEAWRRLAADRAEARLLLVGEGGHYRSVESEVRKTVGSDDDLARSVTFTGWVEDVASLMEGCDIFVLPSVSEGMSNSLLEACAMGRVVVASDIPPNTAVVGDDYPLLYSPGDPERLLRCLRVAFDDDATRKVSRDRVLERVQAFGEENVLDGLERLIYDAASRPRHKHA